MYYDHGDIIFGKCMDIEMCGYWDVYVEIRIERKEKEERKKRKEKKERKDRKKKGKNKK